MIGIVDYMGSTSSSGSFMDRKRRRLNEAEEVIDLKTLTCLSNPPTWHSSLKQHLNHVAEEESKNSVKLNDVTQLLVDSGYVSIVDIYNLSQTCKDMCRATTYRQSIWKSICLQEFPSGTRQIPPMIVQEKGYKWLYREWKSSIHSSEGRRKRAKVYVPLPPPRLSADQMVFYIHINGQNDRPLHNIPVCVTGNDLLPLLNDGKMTYCFPAPVLVPISKNDFDGKTKTVNNKLHVRIHFLSLLDASMCCVYNERTLSPWRTHEDAYLDDVNHRSVDTTPDKSHTIASAGVSKFKSHQSKYVDLGPTDVATYRNCDLQLRNSPAASEIKQRLFCTTTIVFRVGLHLADESDNTYSNQADCTSDKSFISINGLYIEVMKYERLQNSCTLFESVQKDDKDGGVTLLHYLSELQLS
jgi:hypothetical protein